MAEWNDDDIALVDSVGADLGRAIVQANLYERQLELVRQLQDLDRAKSEFLSTFSHELRTPLTSIRAYTELLRDEVDDRDGDQDRMLEIIEKNSVRLSVLIEDILTLSHLNSAVYDIHLVPVDANPLLDAVCEPLLPTAEAKSLTLRDPVHRGPAVVLGDANQLERLLLNLVSNAVKFTPPGGTSWCPPPASASSVVLSVSDTGIGIPADEQEAVFGRFFRGAEATQEVIPGTGLGLAIVQAIVEHHGGTLTLASAPGQGTTVRVGLPSLVTAEARHELQAQAVAAAPIQKRRTWCRWASGPPVPDRTCLATPRFRSTQQGAPAMTTALEHRPGRRHHAGPHHRGRPLDRRGGPPGGGQAERHGRGGERRSPRAAQFLRGAAGPGRARHRAARDGRLGGAGAHPRPLRGARADPDRPRPRAGEGTRPDRRRRRLPDQALRRPGARRPHPGPAAPQPGRGARPGAPRSPPSTATATSRSTGRHARCGSTARWSVSPSSSSSCSRPSSATPARPWPPSSCWSRSGTTRSASARSG